MLAQRPQIAGRRTRRRPLDLNFISARLCVVILDKRRMDAHEDATVAALRIDPAPLRVELVVLVVLLGHDNAARLYGELKR